MDLLLQAVFQAATSLGLNPDKTAAYRPNRPRLIDRLRKAKKESDRKNYRAKHKILRELISETPSDFCIDSSRGGMAGLTHRRTGFRIHMPHKAIPHPELLRRACGVKR